MVNKTAELQTSVPMNRNELALVSLSPTAQTSTPDRDRIDFVSLPSTSTTGNDVEVESGNFPSMLSFKF